jgi:PhoPQ-activated pathogenicity-related protein
MKTKNDFVLALCGLALLVTGEGYADETALDRYVAMEDTHYSWRRVGSDGDLLQKTYFLNLVSQQWRNASEVDHPVWEHELIITVPAILRSHGENTVVLLIDGGSNISKPIDEGEDAIGVIANVLGSVVAVVRQIPNQPLYFADEVANARTEDEILSYSMDKFMDTGDENWPVHLPMTKSVVRAMDAVQEFLSGKDIQIDDFIVMGGSKRGWTTWLTAAVDPRVKAILPISADLLNLKDQFNHHWDAYGFYTEAVGDYVGFDLSCRLQSVRGQELSKIIDPHYYRDRFTMPKLLINSTGDQFFVTDSADLYYDQLPEPKLLRNTFNTDHKQGDSDSQVETLESALLWIDGVNKNKDEPDFTSTLLDDGSIRITTGDDPQPDKVLLWQATNPQARDFRLEEIGDVWESTSLRRDAEGAFVGRVEVPETGFIAYAVELRYDEDDFAGLLDLKQYYTSKANILPEVMPFEGTSCLADTLGNLENPAPGSYQSGISVFSGWACDADGVEIELDSNKYLVAAYGTARGDTQPPCGDINNGFGLLYNMNLFDDGPHKLRALSKGRVFGSAEFTSTSLGEGFRRGLSGEYLLEDFPTDGESVGVSWQESQQNFAINAYNPLPNPVSAGGSNIGPAVSRSSLDGPLGNLENPANGSYQSGVAVISGWVCEADNVEIEFDGTKIRAASYGTGRGDTQSVCGDKNNGFGLLYSMNLLGDGQHSLRVLVDGIELARSEFVVTTLGEKFLRNASGEYRLSDFPEPGDHTDVQWDQSRQNFLIRDYVQGAAGVKKPQ